ncbi:unnamed protein product [Mucor hiemalis]
MKKNLLESRTLLLLLFLVTYIIVISAQSTPTKPVEEYRWPSIISQPAVKLLGESCYVTLFEEFHITNGPCMKLAFSKALGLGIVVGGAIVKIPQIITILRHQSAKGLSLASFLLETSAYEIVLVYNTRLQNPFSTYGEVLFMTVQNILISLLIMYYNGDNKNSMIGLLFCGFLFGFMALMAVPWWCMTLLYAVQIPIGLASTTARAFTTYAELDDPIMLSGNLLASVLNGILVFQVFLYWDGHRRASSPIIPLSINNTSHASTSTTKSD